MTKHTNKTNVVVMKSEDQVVQQALDELVQEELARFADFLETARVLWRRHREMVEALEFPADLWRAYVQVNGGEPNDERGDYGPPCAAAIDTGELLPNARIMARAWIDRAWERARTGNGQPPVV